MKAAAPRRPAPVQERSRGEAGGFGRQLGPDDRVDRLPVRWAVPRPIVGDRHPRNPAGTPPANDAAKPSLRLGPRLGATGEPVPVAPMPCAMRWLGHNNGPPWDTGVHWRAFAWKKARAAALKPPPVEVVRRRVARARELGLTYDEFMAAYQESGRFP